MKTVYLLLCEDSYHDFTDIDWKETVGIFTTLKEAKLQKKNLEKNIKTYQQQETLLRLKYPNTPEGKYWQMYRKHRAAFHNSFKDTEQIIIKKYLANTDSSSDKFVIEEIELLG